MKQPPEKSGVLSTLLFLLYLFFFTGLIFSFRAVSSISTGLLLITGIFYTQRKTGRFIPVAVKEIFFIACAAYLLLQAVLYLINDNTARGWQELILKTGLLFIPLAVFYTANFISGAKRKLVSAYILLLLAASLYCLGKAILYYFSTGDTVHFFYHPLVQPLKQHAVYFSLLVFFALLYLLEGLMDKNWLITKTAHFIVTVFLILFLVLLSSKLVLSFTALTLFYYMTGFIRTEKRNKLVILTTTLVLISGMSILLITRNPVSNRFTEILNGDIAVVEQDTYRPDEYFNGLQFRLLQWKLTPMILSQKKAWLLGVGAGNSQQLLTEKYIAKNMYTGSPGIEGKGYGLYNTHNQWLESLLKNGIPGLLCFGLIGAGLVQMARHKKKRILSFTVILLLLYSFTEAILETQYGLIIFIFFPLFFNTGEGANFVPRNSDKA